MKRALASFLILASLAAVVPASNEYGLVQTEAEPVNAGLNSRGGRFFDFGKAAFGTVIFTADSPVAQKMAVTLGERALPVNMVHPFPGLRVRVRTMMVDLEAGPHDYRVSITPDKTNTRPAAIHMPESIGEVMPFRFAELTPLLFPVSIKKISQVRVHYPIDLSASDFSSSDPVLDDVWSLCKYSIFATSFAGLYVDGDRERIPYEADAYINMLGHYSIDHDYTMGRRTHEYLIEHPTWPTEWAMHSVFMAWTDFIYSGDDKSIRRYYPDLKAKTLYELARDDGLISTARDNIPPGLIDRLHMNSPGYSFGRKLEDLVDWPAGERDNYEFMPVNTVVNAFHYRALILFSSIAKKLGEDSDDKFFADRAALVYRSFNEKLFDPAAGLYLDGEGSTHPSLHANMFALAFGLVPPERKARVIEFIKKKGMACSVYAAQYLLEAMFDHGEDDYALHLMTDRATDRSWPHMIYDLHSTITLEAWDAKYKPNLDWNHAWGAAPANIIPRKLMGIEPVEPGFARVKIQPRTAGLTHARVITPTIHGPIALQFTTLPDGAKQYRLHVPPGVSAEVHLYPSGPGRAEEVGEGDHEFIVKP